MREAGRNVASAPLQDDHLRQLADESLRRVLRGTVSMAIVAVVLRLMLLSIAQRWPTSRFGWVIGHIEVIDLAAVVLVLWTLLLLVARERREIEERMAAEIGAIRHRERERANLDIEAIIDASGGELAKDLDRHGRLIYRTRGRDPAGVAEGGRSSDLDREAQRVPVWEERPEHQGLEGPLTKAEEVVVEADEVRARKAAALWEEREASDPDLIEAGVERLGDLLALGGVQSDVESIVTMHGDEEEIYDLNNE